MDISRALPVPWMFPNLRSLDIGQEIYPSTWLAGLGALGRLEHLKLRIRVSILHPEGEAVQLPPFPCLTSLELKVGSDDTLVHLQLSELPTLAELDLDGAEGKAALLVSKPAPQLQRLSCWLGGLSVDFATLPGLRAACFASYTELDRAASIAAATALTCLELREWDPDWEHSSALELLQSLPPSVSCLGLQGHWAPEAAALVGQLTGLSALALRVGYDDDPEPLAAGAPVWAGLRGFSWSDAGDMGDGLNLQQVCWRPWGLDRYKVVTNSSENQSGWECGRCASKPGLGSSVTSDICLLISEVCSLR